MTIPRHITISLLGVRPAPVREDSETTLVDVVATRPRKRVRISEDAPVRCFYHPEPFSEFSNGDDSSLLDRAKGNSSSCQNEPFNRDEDKDSQKRITPSRVNPWLTRRELAYIRSRAKKLSKSLNLNSVLQDVFTIESSDDEDTIHPTKRLLSSTEFLEQRGLERWSSSHHSFLRSLKVIEVKSAVLLEQSTQVLSGRVDPDRLGFVSREASQASQRFAQVLGKVDAETAREVHTS